MVWAFTGTIGHVAHGKSTVVKAISGVQTVRFKNELERNITIKLGYANAKIYKAKDPRVPRYDALALLYMPGFLCCTGDHLSFSRRKHGVESCSIVYGNAPRELMLCIIGTGHGVTKRMGAVKKTTLLVMFLALKTLTWSL